MTSAFEAHAIDIPADESAQTGFNNLSRRSTRWDRHILRQPSTVIVIRSNAGPSGVADAGGAAEDGGVETPLLIPSANDEPCLRVTTHELDSSGPADDRSDQQIMWAQNLSLVANILLLCIKMFAFIVSRSFAVLASTADSGVDLASQVVLYLCNRAMRKPSVNYPIGRSRLETVGVVGCAVIMAVSSFEVMRASLDTLIDFWQHGIKPQVDMTLLLYIVLGVATGIKVLLYFYCIAYAKRSPTLEALAEDHRNDVLSNTVAICTAFVATWRSDLWWVDPTGAILLSVYIVFCWTMIATEQINQMVGRGAPEDYLGFLQNLANVHDERLKLDELRAYHFGQRYLVELEVILPAAMSVQESHDIALGLQHKIEALEEVERCFVHVDYAERTEPEHKIERNLQLGRGMNEPHDSVKDQVPTFESHCSSKDLANAGEGI
jgi:cation diffusion facilitator family transporter